jgi:hypothetical protein
MIYNVKIDLKDNDPNSFEYYVGQTISHIKFLKHTKESDCILLCLETDIEAKYVYNFMQRFYYTDAPHIRVCDENLKVVYSDDTVREEYMERKRQFIEYQDAMWCATFEKIDKDIENYEKIAEDVEVAKLIEAKKLDIRN